MASEPFVLEERPVHLGLSATVVVEPPFTGGAWYADYIERHAADGAEGRLVSIHSFDRPWDSWEMHPHGEELVVCLSGELTLFQELDSAQQGGAPSVGGALRSVTLRPGQAIVNPRGVWHTADVSTPSSALFITAGLGTEQRPR